MNFENREVEGKTEIKTSLRSPYELSKLHPKDHPHRDFQREK
jgi:hypothetical protein